MSARAFGIDFGTTNSLVATVASGGATATSLLASDAMPHPSVVWYRAGGVVVGREARNQLSDDGALIQGDFAVSPKRLMGETSVQFVGERRLRPAEIAAEVLRHLKREAERQARGQVLKEAVFTIPVKLDGRGRRALREAAHMADIEVVQFVHEPLAALYAWIRKQPDPQAWAARMQHKPMLVFDWGGGTLDLTLCVIEGGGRLLQVGNEADHTVGGDEFDRLIRNLVRERHAREYRLSSVIGLETDTMEKVLRQRCEIAKIGLSDSPTADIAIGNYLPGEAGRDLAVEFTRVDLLEATQHLISQGTGRVRELLERVGVREQAVEFVLPTGGMVNMPAIRDALNVQFPGRVEDPSTVSRGDCIIAEGAALIAADGHHLELSKPLEIEEADLSHAVLLPAGTAVPRVDRRDPERKMLYCANPRAGEAVLRLTKPRGSGSFGEVRDRDVLGICAVRVKADEKPFVEELRVEMRLDRDCVVEFGVLATLVNERARMEIYDLEFGLSLPWSKTGSEDTGKGLRGLGRKRGMLLGSSNVRLRTNIATTRDWRKVPGDLVKHYNAGYFNDGVNPVTELQKLQFTAYDRCPFCNQRDEKIWQYGCAKLGVLSRGRPIPGSVLDQTTSGLPLCR